MDQFSNEELLDAYLMAVRLNLDAEFIEQLAVALRSRSIDVPKTRKCEGNEQAGGERAGK